MCRHDKTFLNKWLRRGQSVMEYAILLAIVSAAFIAMAMYVRRAVQGSLYKIEDHITAKTATAPTSGGTAVVIV